ncbi:MAG: tetratricopeptide repeat protein [Alphaproteobacteria bacterium]|nr:tetratricopeptide repeat protein [Alphaproteobacteria bacterium]
MNSTGIDPWTDDPVSQAHMLLDAGKAQEAAQVLAPLVQSERAGLFARLLLGRAQLMLGKTDEAMAIFRDVVSLAPHLPDALVGLGEALRQKALLPAAVAELERALRIDPRWPPAHYSLARCWLEAGEPERARRHIDALMESDLACEMSFLAAEAERLETAKRSPPGFVRHLFDQFSADYDARMIGKLAYAAPQILKELHGLIAPPAKDLRVLDLGCGTGLAGAVFSPLARTMTGVDLSPKMLEAATARSVYSGLHCADIETWLTSGEDAFDLVIAADVLVYLGDLDPVFGGVKRRLVPSGLFLFTVEAQDEPGYRLAPTRRWRHSEAYLREAAARAGFDIAGLMAATPRYNSGEAVPGFAVALRA